LSKWARTGLSQTENEGIYGLTPFSFSIRQVMAERLEMLPANKQIGFFSDAYCVEWSYAKAVLVRKQMARVLANKVNQGQYSRDEAVGIASAILYESPQLLLGMTPRREL
jgi:hypothetical protein